MTMTNTHSLTEIYIQYTNNKRVWLATLHELRTCPHPHSSTLMRKPRAHQGENKVNSRRNPAPCPKRIPTPTRTLFNPSHPPPITQILRKKPHNDMEGRKQGRRESKRTKRDRSRRWGGLSVDGELERWQVNNRWRTDRVRLSFPGPPRCLRRRPGYLKSTAEK